MLPYDSLCYAMLENHHRKGHHHLMEMYSINHHKVEIHGLQPLELTNLSIYKKEIPSCVLASCPQVRSHTSKRHFGFYMMVLLVACVPLSMYCHDMKS